MVRFKNTDGTRTQAMNAGSVIQELTVGDENYGKISVGTDGTYDGEVMLAKDSDVKALQLSTSTSSIADSGEPNYKSKSEAYTAGNTPNTFTINAGLSMINGVIKERVETDVDLGSVSPQVETSTTTTRGYSKGDLVVLDRPNLISNGTFDTDTDWSATSGWTIANGVATSDGTSTQLSIPSNTIAGEVFTQEYEVVSHTSGTLQLYINGGFINVVSTVGKHTISGTLNSGNTMYFSANSSFIGSIDNISVKQKNEIYQAKISTVSGNLLTDTSKFQVKSNLAFNNVVIEREHITSGARDIHVINSLNVYGRDDSNDDILLAEGYTLLSGSKNTYTDGTYYVKLIDFFSRLNDGGYHPIFNKLGCDYLHDSNGSGGYQWYRTQTQYVDSLASTISNSTGVNGGIGVGVSQRPDGRFYDKIYLEGLNGITDRRIDTRVYSPQEALLVANERKELREGYEVECIGDTLIVAGANVGIWIGSTAYKNIVSGTIPSHILFGSFNNLYSDYTCFAVSSDGTNIYKVYAIQTDGVYSKNNFADGVYTIVLYRNSSISTQCKKLAVDAIGNPVNYDSSWTDRLTEGRSLSFNPLLVDDNGSLLIPDGTKTVFKFSEKATSTLQVLKSTNSGGTWSALSLTTHYSISTIANTITFVTAPLSTDIILISNTADIDPIAESTPLPFKDVKEKAIFSNDNSIHKGGDFTRAITGKVPTSDSTNSLEIIPFSREYSFITYTSDMGVQPIDVGDTVLLVDGYLGGQSYGTTKAGEIYECISDPWGASNYNLGSNFSYKAPQWKFIGYLSYIQEHGTPTLNTDNSSCSKRAEGVAVDSDNLAYLQVRGKEILFTGGVYVDDGDFSTDLVDENGNAIANGTYSRRLNFYLKD